MIQRENDEGLALGKDWLPGGWGIMIDDVLAGLAAALLLFIINLAVISLG